MRVATIQYPKGSLFHVKHSDPRSRPNPRRLLPAALVLFALLITACWGGVAAPQGWAAPVEGDGLILASFERGKLSAVDARSGERRWTFPPEADKTEKLEGLYGTPVVQADTIYLGAYNGVVYALSVRDGSVRWRHDLKERIIGAATLSGGLLWIGTDKGKLYALRPENGESARPPIAVSGPIWSQPLIQGNLAYLATMDHRLVVLDLTSGQSQWSLSFPAALPATPVLAGDRLIVGGLDKQVYGIDLRSRERAWTLTGKNWFWMQPLLVGDTVYIADLDGYVYALQVDNGQMVWERPFKAAAPIKAQPVLAGATLIIVDWSGRIYGLDPRTGSPVWQPQVLEQGVLADPTRSGGNVLILQRNGALVRLNPGSGTFTPIVQPQG